MNNRSLLKICHTLLLGCVFATGAFAAEKSAKVPKEPSSVKRNHEQIVKSLGLYDDQSVQDYVNEVGRRVAAKSALANADFKFYVVDDENINAFTTGCCRVYVHRGLLINLNSEAELAAVLGHEVGHVVGRHPQKQQTTGVLAQILAAGAAVASGSQAVADLANSGATAAFRGYGRSHDMEADRYGLEFATKAGYRPESMGEVFNMFKNGERFEKERARAEGREPQVYHGLFASHPAPDRRMVQAAKGAARITADPEGGWLENRDEYMRRIDGMAFGSSKAQGVVRDNRLYHAPLGMTVAFPRGWTVENQPDKVVAYTPAKDAYVIMTLAPSDPKRTTTPREVLLSIAQGKQLSAGEAFESNGMQGYTAISATGSSLDQGQGPVRLVVLERGASYFLYLGASKSSRNGIPDADGVIQSVAQTMRALKPSEFPLAEPYRVKVLKATADTRLAEYASALPADKYQREQLQLMNGIYPNGEPKPGQLFKVVE